MTNFSSITSPSNNIKTVDINKRYFIGDYLLVECCNLASITIPGRVTYIGNSAFSGCSGLTNMTIPDSVTSI